MYFHGKNKNCTINSLVFKTEKKRFLFKWKLNFSKNDIERKLNECQHGIYLGSLSLQSKYGAVTTESCSITKINEVRLSIK